MTAPRPNCDRSHFESLFVECALDCTCNHKFGSVATPISRMRQKCAPRRSVRTSINVNTRSQPSEPFAGGKYDRDHGSANQRPAPGSFEMHHPAILFQSRPQLQARAPLSFPTA